MSTGDGAANRFDARPEDRFAPAKLSGSMEFL